MKRTYFSTVVLLAFAAIPSGAHAADDWDPAPPTVAFSWHQCWLRQ